MENDNLLEIRDVLAANPDAAHFMADLCNGVPLAEAAANHFGSPVSTPEPEPPTETPPASDLQDEIARAEERGYLRGRNEAATQIMAAPAVYQPVNIPAPDTDGQPIPAFLASPRQSFWDID